MAERKSLLRRFFGGIWALFEFLRRTLVVLVMIVVLAVIVVAIRGGPPIVVPDGGALVLVPTGQIVDSLDADPRTRVAEFLLGEEPSQTRLSDLLDAIDSAAYDTRVRLLFLKLDTGFVAGQAQLEQLSAALLRFRESGKKVFAYAPAMAETEYYLAAHADQVVIDPMGLVWLTGFESYPLYFREGLDKLGIDVNIFRVGDYKSAVEPFLRNDMSDAARADARRWLDSLWGSWVAAAAAARGLEASAIDDYVNAFPDRLQSAGGDTALAALDAGLVDHLMTLEQVRAHAGEIVGMDPEHGSFRQIDHRRYLAALDQRPLLAAGNGAPVKSVGVVVVQGEIVDGRSEPGFAGGVTVSELIREGRDDPNVAAMVLRVESPGGSVYASEQIRRALASVREAGKPVAVSMASVAASGGYWVSTPAQRIFAHPTTITGSIGIFGLVPTFRRTLEKIGVHSDGVGTTIWAGGLSAMRDLGEPARDVIQLSIEKDYQRFISRVAEGRELPVERVRELAGGRIWAGADALQAGLVDQLGDLDQAIEYAAGAAGLGPDEYGIYPIEPAPDFRVELLRHFSGAQALVPAALRPWLGGLLEQASRQLRRWSDPRGSYAHCLCRPQAGAGWGR